MNRAVLGLLAFAAVGMSAGGANAWFHAGSRGVVHGGDGSWSAHGWRGGSASGGGGSWSGTGWRGGTASGYHYGGAYHYNGSYYGTYHPPTTVNYYGSNCYGCGGWNTGGAAAGLVAGTVLGAAAASAGNAAANANAYAAGVAAGAQAPTYYGTLPSGCLYKPYGNEAYYQCNGFWVEPAFGANGVYYRTVAAP
jgi:hypothetical protein